MMSDPVIRITVLIGPGLRIDRIDRKDDAFALINPRRKSIRQMKILKVEESSILAGNEQDRSAMMAVYLGAYFLGEKILNIAY